MRTQDSTFTEQRIVLDGNQYKDCTFTGCLMVYSGGITVLDNCQFDNCDWLFGGAAKETINFLRALYGMAPNGKEVVERTFQAIRSMAAADPPQKPS